MVSSKEHMRRKADRCALQVQQAGEQCDAALWELRQTQSKVEAFWQGESGEAMYLALDDAIRELARISTDLQLLKNDMQRHTDGLAAGWPE